MKGDCTVGISHCTDKMACDGLEGSIGYNVESKTLYVVSKLMPPR